MAAELQPFTGHDKRTLPAPFSPTLKTPFNFRFHHTARGLIWEMTWRWFFVGMQYNGD
jgi:hypothetical protein